MTKYIKNTLMLAMLVAVAASIQAQTLSDALRYSVLNGQSTARVAGVAGAFGSMGGDVGVLNINPAGLANYYKSELTLTPTLTATNVDAFLVADSENLLDRAETKFGVSNIAGVFTSRPSTGSWVSSNFAITYSKLADLNRGITYRGTTLGSYSQSLDEIPTILFEVPFESAMLEKTENISQSGYVSELTLAWAGSYKNKFDLGISMGIPFLSFEENKTYSESDQAQALAEFGSYTRNEFLTATGAGVNFKAGLVYKGIKPLRLGASIHSPSFYTITEEFGYDDQYTFDGGNTDALESEGNFKYTFRNPWKYNASVGVLYSLGKLKGFANVDVERVHYTSASFDLSAFDGSADDITYGRSLNERIDKEFKDATNFRIGTELAYDKVRFRAGVALTQSAFEFEEDSDYNNQLGLGLGYRGDSFFIDLAYSSNNQKEGYIAYEPKGEQAESPLANFETTRGAVQLTAGFKF